MKHNKDIIHGLSEFIKQQKDRGHSINKITKTVKNSFLQSPEGIQVKKLLGVERVVTHEVIRAGHFSVAYTKVYTVVEMTPLVMAQQLKLFYENPNDVALGLAIAYPDLSSTQVGQLILHDSIYPNLNRNEMQEALLHAGFSVAETAVALNSLYQSIQEFTVKSVPKWQDSGYRVEAGKRVHIHYKSGRWTANPSTGYVGPTGNSRYVAKPGYTFPGKYEGALIGRIGSSDNSKFLVGNDAQINAQETGNLWFCINDDLRGSYGAGFTDNRGELIIEIENVN